MGKFSPSLLAGFKENGREGEGRGRGRRNGREEKGKGGWKCKWEMEE